MTIYWERCDICGRYHVVKQCTMFPDIMVCPHCCLACIHRSRCPRPAWYPSIKATMVKKTIKPQSEEAKKVLLDLLSKLDKK